MTTGYEPLNTLKPVAEGLWIIDGPAVRSFGFPFSTRATVVRLETGELWVHSPTELTASLRAELDALGPVRHLIAPNQIHFVHVNAWVEAYPGATFWAAPDVHARAAKNGLHLPEATPLAWDRAEAPWQGQLDQLIVRGSSFHKEAVFFHRVSRTLIVTDLIEAFDTAKLPAHCRPFVWLNGIDNTDGKMPPLLRWTYKNKAALAEDIETLVGWAPRRIILAHGDCYDANGAAELQRAFRKLLNARAWEKTVDEIKARENR
ncbi:DUF4336 domain-containing protein [Roseovarius faecimaris]|uniref:DUF4336 domain-containing protein n=1 Tax=Roseovarius faecimaris TaxID=2494550 RepID=A0A6I6IPU3_9RHOB|nr:DUF4336 domain-containing protein [Roseovarius faecimaris]QGX98735.1 DUF4336 domain-containing protein [Roseovarius faecimaris]